MRKENKKPSTPVSVSLIENDEGLLILPSIKGKCQTRPLQQLE